MASKREIIGIIETAMLSGDDVLYMMRLTTVLLSKEAAILAMVVGTPANEIPRVLVHPLLNR